MNHSNCELCGRPLLPGNDVRYEVKIEVKAAYDPLDMRHEHLDKDFRAEIARLLRQLDGVSAEEAEDEVYRTFAFDLCRACQRRYVKNPLPPAMLPP